MTTHNEHDNTPNQEYRQELDSELSRLRSQLDDWKSVQADISKSIAELSDAVDIGFKVTQFAPEYGDWETAIENTKSLNEKLHHSLNTYRGVWVTVQPVITTAGTATILSHSELVSSKYLRPMHVEDRARIIDVEQQYSHLFERTQIREELLNLMQKCGLHTRAKGNIAIEKFNNAWQLYEQNPLLSDPAIGSLISLREAIDWTINDLFDRRPNQKEKTVKIKDIGEQLAVDSLSKDVFDNLANNHTKLHRELSGAKDKIYGRDDEGELMRRGTYFLRELLGGIDPSKIR